MNETELVWKERTSDVDSIASVWTCNASDITSRTVLADPCISLILIKSADSSEIVLRGPETKPRSEVLLPGYTWTAIRLQPGIQIRGFATEHYLNDSNTLSADTEGQFEINGVSLQFPGFHNAERLIERMHNTGLISGHPAGQDSPQPSLSSKSYSRFVKRSTGLSPYKLHQLQRIHEALQLIKQGLPATTVAVDLGFVDQAHLTRAAKQFLGHTPKELLHLPQKP